MFAFLNELHFICCATSVDILVINPVLWPYRHPPRAATCVIPNVTAGAPRQDACQTLAARSSSKQQTSRDSGNLFVTNVCARLFISLHTAHIH